MEEERWRKVREIFEAALERPAPERGAFLDSVCAGDTQLREQVGQLLRDDKAAEIEEFLDDPGSRLRALRDVVKKEDETEIGTGIGRGRQTDPERIGPYQVLEKIGEGGMGVVYLAEQQAPMRRRVALKIIKLGMDTKEVVARFEAERQALALMSHPNIARVYYAGSTERGRPYFVMEYVPGVEITQYCDQCRLNTRQRLELFVPVCEAVHHAHQKGVIHRDLKPPNVLVTVADGKAVPKIIDFGVAKAINQRLTERTVFTGHGQIIGTPEYMSPEQAEMSGLNVDTTTDVYSLGVILYELLVGALPFEPQRLRAAGWNEIQRIIREVDPPKPSTRISSLGPRITEIAARRQVAVSTLEKQVRGELDWIIMRAMEKDRTRRYPAASELAADVGRYLHGEAVAASPPSASYRLRKTLRRHRRVVASALLVFAALAAGLIVSTSMYLQAEKARERERQETRKAQRINAFLQDMLKTPDPAEKGRDVTVREVLDEAAASAETQLSDQPEVQAAVRSTIGNTYLALGLYDQAESHLRTSLTARERLLGEANPEVASGLNDLAALLRARGDLKQAEPLLRRALELDRRNFGDAHPTVATTLNNLALVLKDRNEYAQAESLYREALEIRRATLGPDDPDIAKSLSNLGTLLSARGKYSEAEPLLREALERRRRVLRANHPDLATSLNSVGILLQAQEKYAEAESPLRESLSILRALHGDAHPVVASALGNLATVIERQGRCEEAEQLQREALALYRTTLGSEHSLVAKTLNNLANLLGTEGKYSEAESLHRQALAMRRKLLGDQDPDVATSLCNLASLLHDQGRLAEAEPLYRQALAIRRERLGAEHPLTANVLLGLGALLTDRGDPAGAETLLRDCVRIRQRSKSRDSWTLAHAQNVLGHCLSMQGHYAEAETLMTRGLPILLDSKAVSLRRKREALEHVIELYEAWGKSAEAASYRAQLAGLREGR